MDEADMFEICVPFIESMIEWVDSLGTEEPYLIQIRKELVAMITVLLESGINPNLEQTGNAQRLTQISNTVCANEVESDDDTDSNDSLIGVNFNAKVSSSDDSDNEVQTSQPKLSWLSIRDSSDYYIPPITLLNNFIIKKLKYFIKSFEQKNNSAVDVKGIGQCSPQVLRECGASNYVDVPRKINTNLNKKTYHNLRNLYSDKPKKLKGNLFHEIDSKIKVLEDKKSSKCSRVLWYRINLNNLKYARKLSEKCLTFTPTPGGNRAFRSSEIWESWQIPSTSKSRMARTYVRLRSDTAKGKPEENTDKTSVPQRGKKLKANAEEKKESEASKTSITGPQTRGSQVKSENGEKTRSPGGPSGSKPANNSSNTDNNNRDQGNSAQSTSQSSGVGYHESTKRRRLTSEDSDDNNSNPGEGPSGCCEHIAQRTRSKKKAKDSEKAKEAAKSNIIGTGSDTDSEDSFGGTTDEDTKTITEEEYLALMNSGDARNDENVSSPYDAPTDEGPPSVLTTRSDESRDQLRSDNSSTAEYDVPTDVDSPRAVSPRNEDLQGECSNDYNASTVCDAKTDEDPLSIPSFHEEESQNRKIEKAPPSENVQADENDIAQSNVEEPQESRQSGLGSQGVTERDEIVVTAHYRNLDYESPERDVNNEEPPNYLNEGDNVASGDSGQITDEHPSVHSSDEEGSGVWETDNESSLESVPSDEYEMLLPEDPPEWRLIEWEPQPVNLIYNNMITGRNRYLNYQILMNGNNEEPPEFLMEGDNTTNGDSVQIIEEPPNVPSFHEEESRVQGGYYYNRNTENEENEGRQSVICEEDEEESKVNNVMYGDEQGNGETSTERMNGNETVEDMEIENENEDKEEDKDEEGGGGEDDGSDEDDDEHDDDDEDDEDEDDEETYHNIMNIRGVVYVDENSEHEGPLISYQPMNGTCFNFNSDIIRQYFTRDFNLEMERERNYQSQSYSENSEEYMNPSNEDQWYGNNPMMVQWHLPVEENSNEENIIELNLNEPNSMEENPTEQNLIDPMDQYSIDEFPFEEKPIELIDYIFEEPEDNIILIDPELADPAEISSIPSPSTVVDDFGDVDSNPGFVVGEARSLAGTELESLFDEDCEPQFEDQDDVQSYHEETVEANRENIPEAEQVEPNLADREQTGAGNDQRQQPTTGQTNSDPPVTPSIVEVADPETAEAIWRSGPLRAEISINRKPLFECNIEDCSFATRLYYLFKDHINSCHSSALWTGQCEECEGEVPGDRPLTVRAALKHLTHHIRQSEVPSSVRMLESGEGNITEFEAYEKEVTTELKKFQKKRNGRQHRSSKQKLSTANISNEFQEGNSSSNPEERDRTSDFNEESSNSDENSMWRIQYVENVNPQVLGCEMYHDEVGSAMKSQINEIKSQKSDKGGSKFSQSSRSKVRDRTDSVCTAKTSKTHKKSKKTNFKRPYKRKSKSLAFPQLFELENAVQESIDSVFIPKTSKKSKKVNFELPPCGSNSPSPDTSQFFEPQIPELTGQRNMVLYSCSTQPLNDNGLLRIRKLKISRDKIRPKPRTLRAICDFSPPSNHTELKKFLKLVRLCREFIKDYKCLYPSLRKVLKQSEYVWNDAEQKVFDELKHIFKAEPILHFPSFNEGFILTSEIRSNTFCWILSQGEIENGRVIRYASDKMQNYQVKFSSTEKELMGIIWGVKYFKLYRLNRSFKIVTTHEPLTWLISCEPLGGMMAKLTQKLHKYHFELHYCDRIGGSAPSGATSQSVSQSADTSRSSDRYENFIKFHYTAQDIPKVPTHVTSELSHTPLVVFFSRDLSIYNQLSQYIRNNFKFDLVKERINLYDVIELKNGEQTIYICICRHVHFERFRYQDIFCSLKSLRNFLDKKEYSGKIYILDITNNYKHIQKDILSEIIVYVFRNSNVEATLLSLQCIIPIVDRKQKIPKKNRRRRLKRHYDFIKTYAKIEEEYTWKTMKYVIF